MQGLNLSKWAVSRPTLVLFLMLVIGLGGLMSYLKLGRAEDPSFTIKVANVIARWPGSTAKEMRDQVGDLMEKKLQELPFLDKIDTYTKPGFLAMSVTFKDTTPPSQVPALFYQLRKKLGDIHDDLPAGVKGPSVNDEFGDVDSVLYAVSGEGADYHQLELRRRSPAPAPPADARRRQSECLRQSGPQDFRRIQPGETRQSAHCATDDF